MSKKMPGMPTADEREEIEYIAYLKEKTVADVEEEARKIIRYDRAVELLREVHSAANEDADSLRFWGALGEVEAFLAKEPSKS